MLATVLPGCDSASTPESSDSSSHLNSINTSATTSMVPIDWSDIYVVSTKRRLATESEIDIFEQASGTLPDGYRDFVTEFGFGDLNDVRLVLPEQLSEETALLREHLQEWVWGRQDNNEPIIIPPSSVNDGVPFAESSWGDCYFCSPSQPSVLWHLWPPHDWGDSEATVLPLGFRNLFLHQTPGQPLEDLGPDDLIFQPTRPTFIHIADVAGPDLTDAHTQSVAKLRNKLVAQISPDKETKHEYGVGFFVTRWGASLGIGFRPYDSKYAMNVSMDVEYENEYRNLLSVLEKDGYTFTEK